MTKVTDSKLFEYKLLTSSCVDEADGQMKSLIQQSQWAELAKEKKKRCVYVHQSLSDSKDRVAVSLSPSLPPLLSPPPLSLYLLKITLSLPKDRRTLTLSLTKK